MNKKIGISLTRCLAWVPDSIYLKALYFQQTGKVLNLSNPQTFNEKLQWLLYYKPVIPSFAGECEARGELNINEIHYLHRWWTKLEFAILLHRK